jgi:hypothetical protein
MQASQYRLALAQHSRVTAVDCRGRDRANREHSMLGEGNLVTEDANTRVRDSRQTLSVGNFVLEKPAGSSPYIGRGSFR